MTNRILPSRLSPESSQPPPWPNPAETGGSRSRRAARGERPRGARDRRLRIRRPFRLPRRTPLLTFEGELNLFPSDIPDEVPVTSSRLEGLFGVKIGPRFDRFSVFGKIRPGFVPFGEPPRAHRLHPYLPAALELRHSPRGDVLRRRSRRRKSVDCLSTERSLVRFDVSDLMLKYPGPVINRDREAFTKEDSGDII